MERLVAVIEAASRDRCPVAPSDPEIVVRLANVARRRWSRGEGREPAAREEYLAKALRDALEDDRRLVGSLMEDYRYLAGLLAQELRR